MAGLGRDNKTSVSQEGGNGDNVGAATGSIQGTLFPVHPGHWQDPEPARRWPKAPRKVTPPGDTNVAKNHDPDPQSATDLAAAQFTGSVREAHSRRTPLAQTDLLAVRRELMESQIRPFLEVCAYRCKRVISNRIGNNKLTAKGGKKLTVAESLRYYYRDMPNTERAKISVDYDSAKRFLKALNSLVKELRKEPKSREVGSLISEIKELKHLTKLNYIIEQGGLKTLGEEVISQVMTRRIPTTKSEKSRGRTGEKVILWLERLYPDPNSVQAPFLMRQDGGLYPREVIANGLLTTLKEGFPQNPLPAEMFEALLSEPRWQEVAKRLGWKSRNPGEIRDNFLNEFLQLLS